MEIYQFKTKKLAPIALFTLLVGCSSNLSTYSKNTEATPQIDKAEINLAEAQNNQADVFAPDTYAEAQSAFKEAKEERSDNESNVSILAAIEKTNNLTQEAIRKSEISQAALPLVAEARLAAIKVRARESSKKEFEAADEELKEYTSRLENGKIKNSTKTAKTLVTKYQSLEVNGIIALKLGAAKKALTSAKSEGAVENAPKSWARANTYLNKAIDVIRANPHDSMMIDPVSGEAQFEAEKLLRVTRKTKAAGGPKSEDIVLQAESQKQYIHSQDEELAAIQNEKQEIQSEVKDLKAVKELQDKVAAVSRNFNKAEADVYQQGRSVVIRLKGIKFPNNKGEIPSSSFDTLKKVQESIASFTDPQVRIEGHTDAIGGNAANLPLSLKRADSVKRYMTANLNMNETNLQSEGLGSSKPIATNKTAAGRAQNRRVDVVIQEM
ncbi:MAG: OmpA family protein [Bdellovibrionota bacterium]